MKFKLNHQRTTSRFGLTLVEVLVATVVTLLIAIALVSVFKVIGAEVTNGRASLELSGKMRGIARHLQSDLDHVTVAMRPWPTEESGLGYFEYFEGSGSVSGSTVRPFSTDVTTSAGAFQPGQLSGDTDDYIAFTAFSDGEPFVGEFNGQIIESRIAEVIWWIDVDANADPSSPYRFTVHRRVLLVRPDLNDQLYGLLSDATGSTIVVPTASSTDIVGFVTNFINNNDVSIRFQRSVTAGGARFGIAANSLADLTRREFRFGRNGTQVDNNGVLDQTQFPFYPTLQLKQFDNQESEDLMLQNALAFDVRAYDPTAILKLSSTTGECIVPGDPGYLHVSTVADGRGAFVDLNYSILYATPVTPPSLFSARPNTRSRLGGLRPAYDTWSWHYEHDGIDQDDGGMGLVDEGSNGLDDDYDASDSDTERGIDDISERETSPPYPYPLRGLQVTIRGIEPNNQIVRQMTVTADFVPE